MIKSILRVKLNTIESMYAFINLLQGAPQTTIKQGIYSIDSHSIMGFYTLNLLQDIDINLVPIKLADEHYVHLLMNYLSQNNIKYEEITLNV